MTPAAGPTPECADALALTAALLFAQAGRRDQPFSPFRRHTRMNTATLMDLRAGTTRADFEPMRLRAASAEGRDGCATPADDSAQPSLQRALPPSREVRRIFRQA